MRRFLLMPNGTIAAAEDPLGIPRIPRCDAAMATCVSEHLQTLKDLCCQCCHLLCQIRRLISSGPYPAYPGDLLCHSLKPVTQTEALEARRRN